MDDQIDPDAVVETEYAYPIYDVPAPVRRPRQQDPGFVPTVRGSVSTPSPIIDAPRPLAYMTALRCVDDTLCSALDHAVLELLITSAQEIDPSLTRVTHTVSVQALLDILGPTVRRTELRKALEHLSQRYFDLPALPVSKGRRRFIPGMKLLPGPSDRLFALLDAGIEEWQLKSFEDQVQADRGLTSDDVLKITKDCDLSPAASRMLEDLEKWAGVFYTTDPDRVGDVAVEPLPAPEADLREERGRIEFRPIASFSMTRNWIKFFLDDHLLAFLDPTRRVKGRRLPYVYLDVRAMTAFRSRYTAPLYRRVVAGTSETVRYPRRIRRKNRAPIEIMTDGRRHRIGAWLNTHSLDSVAGAVSYAWTAGGKAAQFKRAVLGQVQRDLATLPDTLRVELTLANAEKGQPAALNFGVRHLPRQETIKSSSIPELQPEGDRWSINPVAPPDSPFYSVRVSTWASAATWLGCRSVEHLRPYVYAWHAAIGEIECPGEAHFGNLTRPELSDLAANLEIMDFSTDADGNDAAVWGFQERTADPITRSCRFERLKALIEEVGADRAVLAFVAEEYAHPDLTQIGVADALQRDGTMQVYRRERERRYAASLEEPLPDALPHRRYIDGLARFMRGEKYTSGGRKLSTAVERIPLRDREFEDRRATRRSLAAFRYNDQRREARRLAKAKRQ